jgi:hypothetical protein
MQMLIQALVGGAAMFLVAPLVFGTPLYHPFTFIAVGGGAAWLYTIWSVRRQMRRDGDKGHIHSITPGADHDPKP